jgi:phosphonate transport system substrate-binding protein
MRRLICPVLVCSLLVLFGYGCGHNRAFEYEPIFADWSGRSGSNSEYAFGVFPLHNSVRLFQVYQPMIDDVNLQAVGFSVKLQSSRDYPSYEAKLQRRELPFALINQAITVAGRGYRIFGKVADDDRFRGILVVRKDSGIRTPRDLKGAAVSFPAPTAFAASMMTKLFLKKHGLDVETEAVPKYVGSQDSSVMNVYLGLTRAGGTWPPTWDALKKERPDVVQALDVKWRTAPLVNLALVARSDVPEAHVRQVAAVLFDLHKSAHGRAILQRMEASRYEPATSVTYDPVRRFVGEYRRLFGDVPQLEGARR